MTSRIKDSDVGKSDVFVVVAGTTMSRGRLCCGRADAVYSRIHEANEEGREVEGAGPGTSKIWYQAFTEGVLAKGKTRLSCSQLEFAS